MTDNPGKKNEKRKDWYTGVMIVQSVVCAIITIVLFASAKSDGKFAGLVRNEYTRLMTNDYTNSDFKEAFENVKNYVYASVASGNSKETVTTASAKVTEQETESKVVGGGADLAFTSLNALEGVSFGAYSLNFDIIVPVTDYEITSVFGYRVSPVTDEVGIHTGIDMACDYGTPIKAAADGTVADAGIDSSYGNYVKLRHTNSVVTIYAHCSKLNVKAGDKVKQGDTIAFVGSTGDSTGNHLHFEMRKDNIRINPEYALKKLNDYKNT